MKISDMEELSLIDPFVSVDIMKRRKEMKTIGQVLRELYRNELEEKVKELEEELRLWKNEDYRKNKEQIELDSIQNEIDMKKAKEAVDVAEKKSKKTANFSVVNDFLAGLDGISDIGTHDSDRYYNTFYFKYGDQSFMFTISDHDYGSNDMEKTGLSIQLVDRFGNSNKIMSSWHSMNYRKCSAIIRIKKESDGFTVHNLRKLWLLAQRDGIIKEN